MYMCFDMAGIQMIYGNPDLKPERSHNFNLSLERNGNVSGNIAGGAYSVAVSCFHTYYDSRITTAEYPEAVDGQPAAIYTNERSVSATGVDVNARYAFRWGFGVSASYNFLHLAGNTVDSSFSPPRPHSATWRIDFDRRFNDNYAIYAAISGRYLSEPDCTCKSDQAYSIWKLTLQQRIWRGISLNLAIDNLFNYRPEVYYWNSLPTTGISCSIGISINTDHLFKKRQAEYKSSKNGKNQ